MRFKAPSTISNVYLNKTGSLTNLLNNIDNLRRTPNAYQNKGFTKTTNVMVLNLETSSYNMKQQQHQQKQHQQQQAILFVCSGGKVLLINFRGKNTIYYH